MKTNLKLIIIIFLINVLFISCIIYEKQETDIAKDLFPESQAEIHDVLKKIYDDAMSKNMAGLITIHLDSPKFTKFGPRNFERQSVEDTNKSEAAFFSSVSDLKVELKEIKIDVFGDAAIATYYPHYSLIKDGNKIVGSSRQTLVFLKTDNGWKIIHEHGTPKK